MGPSPGDVAGATERESFVAEKGRLQLAAAKTGRLDYATGGCHPRTGSSRVDSIRVVLTATPASASRRPQSLVAVDPKSRNNVSLCLTIFIFRTRDTFVSFVFFLLPQQLHNRAYLYLCICNSYSRIGGKLILASHHFALPRLTTACLASLLLFFLFLFVFCCR